MKINKNSRRNFLKSATLGVTALTASGCNNSNLFSKKSTNKDTITVRSKTRDNLQTDVLVVGGGPAGIGAAIGAKKAGADTLLIESQAFFGGVAAWSVGMVMNQMRPDQKPRGFIHELLLQKLQNYGDQAVRTSTHQFFVNVDYLKVAILDALDDTGCKYLVHAKAVDTITEGNRVTGVLFSTKLGLCEIKANVVVDCTGDADIAYFAGAPTMTETGKLSPQTLLLNIGNVDNYSRRDMSGVLAKAKSKYPLLPDSWTLIKVSNCHHFYINHSGTREMGNFDITDPHQFSKAECLSRRQIIQMTQAMREFGNGDLKNCEIVGAGTRIGVRESRRIKGSYILTEEDALNGSKFEDVIAWRSGYLDIGFVRVNDMKIHQVPYRAIIPEQIDNLLAAGRCISASHEAASAGKSMGNCFATGHAAGIAAALSSKMKIVPRELDVKKVQEILTSDGVDLTKGGEVQDNRMAM